MIEDDVKRLRDGLKEYVLDPKERRMEDIAASIGISTPTLVAFLKGKGSPAFRTVLRVENFLKDREGEN